MHTKYDMSTEWLRNKIIKETKIETNIIQKNYNGMCLLRAYSSDG